METKTSTIHSGEDSLLRLCEVRERLRVSKTTLWRIVRTGELKQIRVAGCKRIRASEVERYLKKNEEPMRDTA